MSGRDVALMEAIAKGLSSEDEALAKELNEKLQQVGLLVQEKKLMDETRDYCSSKVCSWAACVSNSSCSGQACTTDACKNRIGGGAVCDNGERTCGGNACVTGACSTKSSNEHGSACGSKSCTTSAY